MALTEEQKKEADKLGMTYELYEALSNITIDPNALSGLSETLAQLNSPAGQADLSAAIAANIGPINPLTMLGLDSGPVFKPLTFIDAAGNPIVVNQNNPTNIPQTFKALQDLEAVDYVFFDGNHQENTTVNYFETCIPFITNDTIFIFDDIHWSAEMERAWEKIKMHPKTKMSLDLFHLGIIFFREEQKEREHFVIRY